jgi:hypothetical protein
MTANGLELRRLLACTLALFVWAESTAAQDDKPGGGGGGAIRSGDSSGGGELPKSGGVTGAMPLPQKPTPGALTKPVLGGGWVGGSFSPGGDPGGDPAGDPGGSGGHGSGHGHGRAGGHGSGSGGHRHRSPTSHSTEGPDKGGAVIAQVLTAVRLLDARGRPLSRVMVGVMDADGRVIALARTDARGMVVLVTPASGGSSLIVERFAIDVPWQPGRAHLLLLTR